MVFYDFKAVAAACLHGVVRAVCQCLATADYAPSTCSLYLIACVTDTENLQCRCNNIVVRLEVRGVAHRVFAHDLVAVGGHERESRAHAIYYLVEGCSS